MSDILRPTDSRQHDPRIDEWLDRQSGELGLLARELVRLIRFHAEGGTETLLDGKPTTCIDGGAYVQVSMEKDHVRLSFLHGSSLIDPAGLLQGKDEQARYIALVPRAGFEAEPIIDLIIAAYDDMTVRAGGAN